MSEKKYVVPAGMREAAVKALCPLWGYNLEQVADVMAGSNRFLDASLEAAVRWLSENPIVPNADDLLAMAKVDGCTIKTNGSVWTAKIAVEWQRRMFLAPEKKILPEIIQLAAQHHYLGNQEGNKERLPQILQEAYEMGKKDGAK